MNNSLFAFSVWMIASAAWAFCNVLDKHCHPILACAALLLGAFVNGAFVQKFRKTGGHE